MKLAGTGTGAAPGARYQRLKREVVMRNIGIALFLLCLGASACGGEVGLGQRQDKETKELASCGGFTPHPMGCEEGYICVDRSPDCSMAVDCPGVCIKGPSGQFCGGFGGIQCPDDLTCVDDPRDDCDPERGGADCGGICVTP